MRELLSDCQCHFSSSFSMIYLSWIFTVVNFSNPAVFSNTHWPCAFIPIGTAVTACVSHLFLGLRMYGISKNKALYAIVLSMTMAELATGVAFGIRMWIMDDPTLLYTLRPFIVSWLTIQMTIDIFVSCFMSCFFHRCRTGYRRTDTVINRLIRGCIQTGAFSAMLAICGLVAFLVRPHTILYAMFMIPIGRTYTTTLMDTLNVRFELKERLMEGIDPHAGNVPWGRRGGTSASAQGSLNRTSAEGTQLSNLARKNLNAVDFPTFVVRDDASMDVYDTGIFKTSRPRGEGGSGKPGLGHSSCWSYGQGHIELGAGGAACCGQNPQWGGRQRGPVCGVHVNRRKAIGVARCWR
ncbi:hypothetical protein D9611_007099 [Ephemerocybe angulata]|uniref:DUF6534 domain-containing protein n=1 Tax=Ephemerocybe angulata TaxID=980116 RepID=A0A8H5B0W2_9AGAR|nr:hypothetical protein D9611_007099 [Tulosesus angulatus]